MSRHLLWPFKDKRGMNSLLRVSLQLTHSPTLHLALPLFHHAAGDCLCDDYASLPKTYVPAFWATKANRVTTSTDKHLWMARGDVKQSLGKVWTEVGWEGIGLRQCWGHTYHRVSAAPALSSCHGHSPWPHGWSAALWWPECSRVVHHRSPGGYQGTKPSSQHLVHIRSFCSSLHG